MFPRLYSCCDLAGPLRPAEAQARPSRQHSIAEHSRAWGGSTSVRPHRLPQSAICAPEPACLYMSTYTHGAHSTLFLLYCLGSALLGQKILFFALLVLGHAVPLGSEQVQSACEVHRGCTRGLTLRGAIVLEGGGCEEGCWRGCGYGQS